MTTPFQNFQAKLKTTGFNYSPTVLGQGQTTPGQQILDKIKNRVSSGESIYSNNRQETTNRVAQDLVQKSAGLKFDEFGKPDVQLGNFKDIISQGNQAVQQRGQNALATEQAKAAFKNAIDMQNIGSYGFTGQMSVNGGATGTDIPGATANNLGAQAASMAMKVAQNHTSYVWGGNSLVNGVDCSGLVQQIYRQLGISVPRTTYEQAKNGKQVPVSQIRPGDLVFYRPGPNGPEHVGIYVGNGHVVHAANPKLGVITSNLNNSNGAPLLILRPY